MKTKKIAIIFLLIIASVGGITYYYWHQATKLPTWYTSQKEIPQNSSVVIDTPKVLETKAEVEQKISSQIESSTNIESSSNLDKGNNQENQNLSNPSNIQLESQSEVEQKIAGNSDKVKNVEVSLNEKDINTLIVSEIAASKGNSKLTEAVKGVNTTIKNGSIEAGAVVNLSKIPQDALGESEKTTLTKLTKTFPFLANQDVYVGVIGKPSVKNGQLILDDNMQVQVGQLRFTVSELAKTLGIPKEQIEKKINIELKLGRLKVKDLEFVDNEAKLKGSPN